MAVLCFNPASVFEMAVPCEAFGLDRSDMGVPGYEVRVCSGDGGPIQSSLGFAIDTPYGLEALRWADTICVAGWPHDRIGDGVPTEVTDELRRAHRRGARLASFCSGAFVLAGAGLLDDHRCTTHWMHAESFRHTHPDLDLDPSVLYVGDGQVFTSAGTAAAIDLCLHLIRLDHGAEVANIVARRMVAPPHRDGGQAQYVEAPMPEQCDDDALASTLAWAVRHLDRDLTVEQLATRARMSARTFARRFKMATGTTPLQWLLNQRVLHARRLLETTTLPVEHIATRCGFGSPAALRQHFGRLTGTSPGAYRQTFRRTG